MIKRISWGVFILLSFTVIVVCCYAATGTVDMGPGTYQESVKVRELIEKKIEGIETQTTYDKIITLRNYVYQHVKVGNKGSFKADYAHIEGALSGRVDLLCGGISAVYMSLVELYEIPVRYVQLLSKGCITKKESCETHVATEVYYNNKWIIEDPTFNAEFVNEHELLGFRELKEISDLGFPIDSRTNGFPMIKGRSIEEYYTPYKGFLYDIEAKTFYLWPVRIE